LPPSNSLFDIVVPDSAQPIDEIRHQETSGTKLRLSAARRPAPAATCYGPSFRDRQSMTVPGEIATISFILRTDGTWA
jgi:hypothetical protein